MSLFVPLMALLAVAPARPDAEALIRSVIASQRRMERALPPHTYDQLVAEVTYGRDGRPKSVVKKLFAVDFPGGGAEGSRELLEVDGRRATPDEKRVAAAEDARGRRKRIDRRAAAQAARPPNVQGEDDDPILGPRRLSEILSIFDYRVEDEEVRAGRLCWVLSFRPKPGLKLKSLSERALASLAGRVVVDAQDLQVRSVSARLVQPVKVAGGLAANVRSGTVAFEAQRLAGGYWIPCRIDMRLTGTTALFFRLDRGWSFRMDNFRKFSVSTESKVGKGGP
jgi:hypothetical protein